MKFEGSVLEDRRTWLLIKELLGGELDKLVPVLDPASHLGFRYLVAEGLLEAGPVETVEILQRLEAAGFLDAELVDVLLLCSSCGSSQIHPRLRCPNCGSSRLLHQETIEHFVCGHVGSRKEFTKEGVLYCPKCDESLEGHQQDYLQRSSAKCLDCGALLTEPRLVHSCSRCQEITEIGQAPERPLYIYRLNQEHRGDIIHYLGYHPEPEAEHPRRRKHRTSLDSVDRRILNLLQGDSRLSFRAIARRLKIGDATVRERVARLQDKDVIHAFTTLVDPEKAGMEVIGLIHLEVHPKSLAVVVDELKAVENVKTIMETGERVNLLVLAAFPTRKALNDFLDKHIRGRSNTRLDAISLVLSLHKLDMRISL
ncbi:MAG: AsnC family transcriptional regulator [Promethearchaeota archaeon]